MNIHVLASGSKGNATIVEHQGRLLLIDMGVTFSYLTDALERLGLDVTKIEAILVTHEHYDHTSGLKYLRNTPIFCTEHTLEEGYNLSYIEPYKTFELIGLEIRPISASHDAFNPVGYVIKSETEKLVYMTDTGMVPARSLKHMKNANYYVFESNHNRKMLHETNRPAELKMRILSDTGHLANEDSAIYLADLVGDKTTDIVLAHISEEANTPDEVIKAYTKIFKRNSLRVSDYNIRCAKQRETVSIIND